MTFNVGQSIRHSVGRSKEVDAVIIAVRDNGLLLVQSPGEGFAKFVRPADVLPAAEVTP